MPGNPVMSLQSPHIPESHIEDDIDLREIAAGLLRHRLWLLAFTVLGIVLGGLATLVQNPSSKICLVINISDGPSIRRLQTADRPFDVTNGSTPNRATFVTTPVQSSLDEVIYSLQTILAKVATKKQSDSITITPLKIANITSETQVALCDSARSMLEARRMINLLETIETFYKKAALTRYQRFAYGEPPSKYWTQITQQSFEDPEKNRSLALGGIGGFTAGCIAAWVFNRRLDRVFSLNKLQGLLGYPLVAKLPPWPWDLPGAQSEIAHLAMQMDPALSWLIFSIGQEHPLVGRLVDALHSFSPDIDLEHIPPLLIAPVNSPDPLRPVGVLVVVQSGFNSSAALQESRRVLASLSFVQEVGVVIVGSQMPSELRS